MLLRTALERIMVTEGLTLVLTIVAWEYLLDWLSWRFPSTRPYKNSQPRLIRDGRLSVLKRQ